MIAITKSQKSKSYPQHDDAVFEEMLPRIKRRAEHAFRGARRELREDLVAEVVANAFVAYRRLAERGRTDLVYATPLASYAIKQVRQGRRVGGQMNSRDVTSHRCRRLHRLKRHPLGRDQEQREPWHDEVLVEDRNATPAEIAAMRIDFRHWLSTLDRRQRRIAKTLATNESTQQAARKFNLSPGRISQIRRELEKAWLLFQGELAS